MTCESCGAKLAIHDTECPECGSEVERKVIRKTMAPKPASAPARPKRRRLMGPLATHAGALVAGVLIGAVLFGGAPAREATPAGAGSAGMAGLPPNHPPVTGTRKAPPLSDEQMRRGMPAGHVKVPEGTPAGSESAPHAH